MIIFLKAEIRANKNLQDLSRNYVAHEIVFNQHTQKYEEKTLELRVFTNHTNPTSWSAALFVNSDEVNAEVNLSLRSDDL